MLLNYVPAINILLLNVEYLFNLIFKIDNYDITLLKTRIH